MHRRRFLKQSSAALALASIPSPLRALAASPSMLFTPIRRGTGMFQMRGGTIGWLVNPDAVVVVDSQFPESAATCREGLAERSERSIDLLINSHHHGDHTAGNAVLGEGAGRILAHDRVPDLQRFSAESRGNLDQQVYADVTYAETWSESFGDETVTLRHFGPAHTAGDSIIHFEEADVVHMGDLVFNYRHAYIDLNAGADTQNWMVVLERTHEMFSDNTVFVFGHSNPAYSVLGTRENLLVMRDYLGALRETVEAGINAGMSGDEIVAAGLDGFESHMMNNDESGIGTNLRAVHEEFTRVME